MPSKVYYISFKRPLHHFTLIEMLVVIAIIGIIASMLAPAIGKTLKLAHSVSCSNNLRNMGVGVTSYAIDNNGFY